MVLGPSIIFVADISYFQSFFAFVFTCGYMLFVMQGKGKGDFALAGNKEKNVKTMMQKWNTFQDAPK